MIKDKKELKFFDCRYYGHYYSDFTKQEINLFKKFLRFLFKKRQKEKKNDIRD